MRARFSVSFSTCNEFLLDRRINPFDQSGTDLVDTPYDNAAFSQNFTVRFLGSMEVKKDRGTHWVSKGGREEYLHFFLFIYLFFLVWETVLVLHLTKIPLCL